MTTKTTKTILFASLIAAMILPFSTMDAFAAPEKCEDVQTIPQGKSELTKLENQVSEVIAQIDAEENRLLAIAKTAYDKGNMIKALAAIERYDDVLQDKLEPIQKCGKSYENKIAELEQNGVTSVVYNGDSQIKFVDSPINNLDFDMDKTHIDCGLNWNSFHTDGTYNVLTDEFNMDNNTWPTSIKGWTAPLTCSDKSQSNPVSFTIATYSSGTIVCQYDANPTDVNASFDTSCSNSFEARSYTVTMSTDYSGENRPTMSKLITLS